jgi:hypothetical protein
MELKALKAKQHDPAGDAPPYTFTPEITPPQASTTQFTLTCLCPFGCRCAGSGGEKKEVEQTPEQRIRMLTSALREEERRRLQAEYDRKQLEAMAETLRRTGNDQANLIKVRSDVRTGLRGVGMGMKVAEEVTLVVVLGSAEAAGGPGQGADRAWEGQDQVRRGTNKKRFANVYT